MKTDPIGTTASGLRVEVTRSPSGGVPPGPSPADSLREAKFEWFKKQFRPHFDEWVIGPIKRLAPSNDALVAFILMSCAIDWLASFWWGEDTRNHVADAYRGFVDRYFLPQGRYDSDGLYGSLRNGLVHLFTIKGGRYALKHNQPALHLRPGKDDLIILNCEDFCSDLIAAKDRYFDEVETDHVLLDKAWERYERDGFLDVIWI